MIFRRRFGELIDRQLDLFEQDNTDLFELLEDAEDEYRRAERADAEERFGDLQELLAEGGETLVDLRDTYAETLDDKAADEYAGAFDFAVLRRFPQWQPQLEVLFECQRVLGPSQVAPRFPEAGESLGDFLLLIALVAYVYGETGSAGWVSAAALSRFIPYTLLKPLQNVPPKPGTIWRGNFYRMDHDGGKRTQWEWAPVGPSFHE